MNTVVLASGGLDSTVAATVARRDGRRLYFLTIAYGQRHGREVAQAQAVGRALGVERHLILELDLRPLGGSALTSDQAVPKDRGEAERRAAIPSTYVPARNTIFLALALAYAETIGAESISLGANVIDYSGYPDCRPEYLTAFETLARLGTRKGVEGHPIRVEAPLLQLSKAEIIRLGLALGAPLHLTHSCYDPAPDGRACGRCDSCRIRREGFQAVGVTDPVPYMES